VVSTADSSPAAAATAAAATAVAIAAAATAAAAAANISTLKLVQNGKQVDAIHSTRTCTKWDRHTICSKQHNAPTMTTPQMM
jgi:hypothetical protein